MNNLSIQGNRYTTLAAYSATNTSSNSSANTVSTAAAPSTSGDQVSLSAAALELYRLDADNVPVSPNNGDGFRPPTAAIAPGYGDNSGVIVTPQNGDGFRPPQDPPEAEG